MRKPCIFLWLATLCAPVCAQSYSDEVDLMQMDDRTIVLKATAAGEKKKEAAELAMKSAFNALFHSGIKDVKNGVPMVAAERKDYDYRFFNEGRYLNYLVGEVENLDSEKTAGRQRVTVRVGISWKALLKDLERNNMAISPGWTDAKAVKATASLNPIIVVVPYVTAADGYGFDAMRGKIEQRPLCRFVVDRVSQEFKKHGYKTRDFISQLQNSTTSAFMQSSNQTDDATMVVQQLPGDIVVTAEVLLSTGGGKSECTLNLRAVEKQTSGKLATAAFSSGQYMTTDSMRLADYAVKKIQDDFFNQLQASFETMIKQGREVFIELGLSQAVDDWDFDQDSPASGSPFKDTLEDWLSKNSFRGVYDMGNSTGKYINVRINIPLWDDAHNRSYSISRFGGDFKKFLKEQLGDSYNANVTSMGQKMFVKIE